MSKHSKKSSTKSKSNPKVVDISSKALTVDCPKCPSKKGHRCVYTLNSDGHKKGGKRNRPHRVRLMKAMGKLAPAKHHKHSSKRSA